VIKITTQRAFLQSGSALQALALLGAGAAFFVASPAMAQDTAQPTSPPEATTSAEAQTVDETQTGEDIVVTGSLFRRTDTETPSPVTVLTSENLENRGFTTITDAIQSLTAGNGGNIPQGFGGAFAAGSTAVSLRGLSTNSTLTLFDGLRAANYPLADDGQRSFVDLNTIQESIVERIEVLRDGASSTYGADAIAGVVNVILKKEIQGVSGRVEAGVTEQGDFGNQRMSIAAGYGDLATQGFNVYIAGEYQRNDGLFARDRGFPYNTQDLTSITLPGGFTGRNGNVFFTPPTSASSQGTTVAIVRPTTLTDPDNILTGTAGATGLFQVLGQGGCEGNGLISHTNSAGTYCEQNLIADYAQLLPEQTRFGGTLHATVDINPDTQAYFAATFYQNRVEVSGTPQSIRSTNPVDTRGISLPVFLSDGTLNPQNPYAAGGQEALLYYRFGDIPTSQKITSRTYRIAAGVDGSFGSGFGYSVAATYMRTDLEQLRRGFLYVPALIDAVNNGTYNFINPSLNSQVVRDTIAPDFTRNNDSELWQVQAIVTKDLFELPGGPLQLGVGGQLRYEGVYAPTAVPNLDYITVNPFEAVGSRNVQAAFFELNAPILEELEINASGRYDHYSTGFGRFSPKVGVKFQPIPQVAIRGTYSQGFRAPSIPETSGAVIGFTNYTPLTDGDPANAAILAAYGNNSYITTTYGLGNNSTGNPDVKPERSRAFTGGIVVQPTSWLSLTVDYYNIRKEDLILSAAGNPADIANEYLRSGDIPDGVTLTLNPADPAHPGLRPTVYSVNFLYSNGNVLETSGLDFQVQATLDLNENVKFTSILEATNIFEYNVDDGTGSGVQEYVGTLAPYAVTSASGTPKWRASWQNTLEAGPFSLTGTANFVDSYYGYADDNSGPGSTCEDAIETSVIYLPDASGIDETGPALQCKVDRFISLDLVGRFNVNDNFTFYVNVINALNERAPFDPNTYGGNNYNPAFHTQGVIGRMFRAGATVKF
jgi:iron complex outermembrane receptor protein